MDLLNLLHTTEVEEEATITKIEVRNSKELFKEKARSDRDLLIIYTDRGSREAHPLPKGIKYNEAENKYEIVDKLSLIRSLRNANSWFRRFIERYRTEPKVGVKVRLTVNQRGFLVIKV